MIFIQTEAIEAHDGSKPLRYEFCKVLEASTYEFYVGDDDDGESQYTDGLAYLIERPNDRTCWVSRESTDFQFLMEITY